MIVTAHGVDTDPTRRLLIAHIDTARLNCRIAEAEYERAVHALDDYEVSQGLPSILAGVTTNVRLVSPSDR